MGKVTHSAAITADIDQEYMRRALQLARLGNLSAVPNPMVGAVIVANERIIGEGYHIRPGEGHAEVNAMASVSFQDRSLIPGSTVYVTLEPCAHQGRTPPCASLLIRERVGRVVVGCIDPFAEVNGRGIAMLRDAGIDVSVGVLEDECLNLNRRFITFHREHRPYITLKWARSADGFIDSLRTDDTTPPAHLSTPATQMHVHCQRAHHQAILVGHRTWMLDNPRLDVRRWFGTLPLRCVLGNISVACLPSDVLCLSDIRAMLVTLHARGIQSLLVEGGRQTLQSFIDNDLWDEAWEECAAVTLGEGVPAPRMACEANVTEKIWGVTFNHWDAKGRH